MYSICSGSVRLRGIVLANASCTGPGVTAAPPRGWRVAGGGWRRRDAVPIRARAGEAFLHRQHVERASGGAARPPRSGVTRQGPPAWPSPSLPAATDSYDDPVTTAVQPNGSRPAGRRFTLLVMVLLAGILGMHALTPSPATTGHATTGHVATGHAAAMGTGHESAVAAPGANCSHTAGSSGHLDHADATCAATGTSSAYAPPSLTPAAVAPDSAASIAGAVPGGAVSGRAPPDLAELQLLRI